MRRRRPLGGGLLAAALALATLPACGAGMADKMAADARARDRVERDAFRVLAPETLRVQAGQILDLTLDLRVAEGFYVPAPASGNDVAGLRLEPPRVSFARVTHVAMPADAKLVQLPGQREPLLCYDGERTIGLRLDVHRGTAPGRRMLTFELTYQLCSVRGCSVPQRTSVRSFVEVSAAPAGGDEAELAP